MTAARLVDVPPIAITMSGRGRPSRGPRSAAIAARAASTASRGTASASPNRSVKRTAPTSRLNCSSIRSPGAEGELAAATTGVEHQQAVTGQRQGRHRSQVRQSGLLLAGDDLHGDSTAGVDGLDERVPVRSLSQTRGAHGDDVEWALPSGVVDQTGDGIDSATHRYRGELAGLGQAFAQPGDHGRVGGAVRRASLVDGHRG